MIDFVGLDTSFHALFASEEAGVADMPMKRMLPIRFGTIRAYRPGAVVATAVARTLRQSPSSIVADIELFDENGKLVLSAETVRIVDTPKEAAADPLALSYRTAALRLDRTGNRVAAGLDAACEPAPPESVDEAAPASEALLLLEAGCLRAAWQALWAATSGPEAVPASDDQDSRPNGQHSSISGAVAPRSQALARERGTKDACRFVNSPTSDQS